MSSASRWFLLSSVVGALVLCEASVASAASSTALPVSSQARVRFGPLGALTDLAVRRILLGDKVAAAKFGTGLPIDDPVREQQVVDAVSAMSVRMGLDPAVSVRFFRAQIEANKVVQRGLYSLWTAHPELRPRERPDLTTEVRPQLDRITGEVLTQLKATVHIRRADLRCAVDVTLAKVSAEVVGRLDGLHRNALDIALKPVC